MTEFKPEKYLGYLKEVLDSFAHAMKTSTKDTTLRRVVADEFLASLERKGFIPKDEYDRWRAYLIEKVEEVL